MASEKINTLINMLVSHMREYNVAGFVPCHAYTAILRFPPTQICTSLGLCILPGPLTNNRVVSLLVGPCRRVDEWQHVKLNICMRVE